MSEFGERLREARIKRSMNQKELAERINLKQASISQFEKGQRMPTPANIDLLAQILEVPREQLAGEDRGEFEKTMLMRNIKGLTPESVKKINDYVELIKIAEKNQKKG